MEKSLLVIKNFLILILSLMYKVIEESDSTNVCGDCVSCVIQQMNINNI